ncbi:MAG: helix-destabilizing protein [Candidatus Hydrogenedentes bacterium]|nr:helix-destabilizing protein [Candidatus Hydrogenedentota bacterium]
MNVVIEIDSPDVFTRQIVAKSSGQPLQFREQSAYLHKPGERYPHQFKLSLGDRPAYQPGRYHIAADSYQVGRFGELTLSRALVLAPVAGQESAAAPRAARTA